MGDGFRLIGLDADDILLGSYKLLQYLYSALDVVCIFHHCPVVCSTVWLTFSTIYENSIDLVLPYSLPLSMEWICCTSKTNNSALSASIKEVVQSIKLWSLHLRILLHLSITLDRNGLFTYFADSSAD